MATDHRPIIPTTILIQKPAQKLECRNPRWISIVETAEHEVLASACICGVGDNVYSLQVIRTSDDSLVVLYQIVGEKLAL